MGEESQAFSYAEMREQELFTDAVIKSSSGQEWSVHKVVMSRPGRFFSTAFSYQSFTRTLDLGVRDNVVEALIDSAYKGSCDISVDNVQEILRAALMYQLVTLVKMCVTFVLDNMLTPEYAIALKVFVKLHQEGLEILAGRNITENLDKFIRRNFIDIYESSDINELEFDQIESLVKEDDLNIPEYELLNFVLEYINFKQLDARKAAKLLANVRLDLIDPANISQIADENPTLGINIERMKDLNVKHRPRWPRDIVIAPHSSMDLFAPEIFNIRKNEWKPMEENEELQDMFERGVIVGHIIYNFEFYSEDRETVIKAFDLVRGHFLAEKESQFPYNIENEYTTGLSLVAWNEGIVASLWGDSQSIVAYYKPDENIWESFPSMRKFAVIVDVDGILFAMGGTDDDNDNEGQEGIDSDNDNEGQGGIDSDSENEEQERIDSDNGNAEQEEIDSDDENEDHLWQSKKIQYYDTESRSWVLCGLLKKNPDFVDIVVVDGKVYVFSLSNEYGECFQPDLTNGIMTLGWFPDIKTPFKKENCQMAVVDNKILFIGGNHLVEGDGDGRKECHIFSPRTGEWSRMSDLNVSRDGGKDFTIDASILEVGRIEEICNGQIVMPDK